MRQLRIALIIVFSFIALAIIALMVCLSLGRFGFNWGFSWDFSHATNYKLVNDRSYDANQIDDINITFTYDEIVILKNSSNKIRVAEYMSRTPAEDELAQISTDNASFTVRAGRRELFGWFKNYYSRVEVYLPESYEGSLDIETTSGSVEVKENVTLTDVDVSSSSGSIRFNEILAKNINLNSTSGSTRGSLLDAEGDITIQSSSGSIGVDRITSSSADLDSTSGSIRGSEIICTGKVAMESSSGSINYDNISGSAIELKSTSGSIRGKELLGKDGISVRCSSGGITFDKIDGRHTLETTSGPIRIDTATVGGEYDSSSGSIRTGFSSVESDITIKATSGSVSLALPVEQAFNFSAESNSGSVNADFNREVQWNEKSDDGVAGSVGSDPKCNINVKTSSGGIRISEYQ